LVLVLLGILTALTVLALAGERRFDGPLLVNLGQAHGVHLGDFIPVTFWVGGAAVCLRLWQHDV